MKIGYTALLYPITRNILNKCIGGGYYDCRKNLRYRINSLIIQLKVKLTGKVDNDRLNYFKGKTFDVDIIHSFNAVCDVENKWCVTFESTVPRTDQTIHRIWEHKEKSGDAEACDVSLGDGGRGDAEPNNRDHCISGAAVSGIVEPGATTKKYLDLCERENCVAMIAMSECTLNIQKTMLRAFGYPEDSPLFKKLVVIHPPQETLVSEEDVEAKFEEIESIDDNAVDSELKFIFVGRDFFRKGGAEVVKALCEYEGKENFSLTVVSGLDYGDYASHSTEEEKKEMERILQEKGWITWHKELPNEEVLKLCKSSHIGLLPTLADTYGYSVLEMQACGVPVITTDVRALPEINNNDCGWVIPLKKSKVSGEAILETDVDIKARRAEVYHGMMDALDDIFRNRDRLKGKGLKSLERIKREHDPEKYSEKLMEIYSR